MRESNSRPPAPKAGIIPLDQSPKKLVGSTGTWTRITRNKTLDANQLHYRTCYNWNGRTAPIQLTDTRKAKKEWRHRRDLNSRGQSPLAFKTNSLTTRTRCLLRNRNKFDQPKKESTTTRFELARAEPSRFRIYLLNHSDTLSLLLHITRKKK